MLKVHIYILIIIFSLSYCNAEQQSSEDIAEIKKSIETYCNRKLEIIKEVDKRNIFDSIIKIYSDIKEREQSYGIKDVHEQREKILQLLCATQHHPTRCILSKKFQEYDTDSLERCATQKCYLMRLYNQLNTHINSLVKLLQPYNDEIIALNNNIYDAINRLKVYNSQEKKDVNLDKYMLVYML